MEYSIQYLRERSKFCSIQQTLRYVFGIVPIVAGLDKFTNFLTHWVDYLTAFASSLLPINGDTFMKTVGVIEIVAGILVLVKPRIGALVVAAWLTLIALQLLGGGIYLDVAVRDLVMAFSAFTLWRLTALIDETPKASAATVTEIPAARPEHTSTR